METKDLTENLMEFGLTRQEANIYLNLYKHGMQTGYEAAKQTGISRSNAYSALAGLVEKGAAYISEGTATKYMAVEVGEFCTNRIRSMEHSKELLIANIPKVKEEEEGYLTISGDEQILHKGKNMLLAAKKRVYLSMSSSNMELFLPELKQLQKKEIKMVFLTDKNTEFPGAKIHLTENKAEQIGIITDSKYVLTGELGNGKDSTCLYSGQSNLVRVFKDSLKNEIKLIELTGGKK